jgi:hypothetical protein
VIYLASENADRLGIPSDLPTATTASGKELVRYHFVGASALFDQALRMKNGEIPKGTEVKRIWSDFFEPFARLHNTMTVVDRYHLARHLSRKGGPTGLENLLSQVNALPGPKDISLFCSVISSEMSREALIAAAEAAIRQLVAGGLQRLSIVCIEDEEFRRIAHDRFVKFGRDALLLGSGLEVLEGEQTSRLVSYSVRECSIELEKACMSLRTCKSAKVNELRVDVLRRESSKSAKQKN